MARVLPPNDGVISWIAGGLLGKDTESHAVMVASGEQCRPRGRAERGGVEMRIPKPRLRNPVERRRWDDTAEGAGNAVALVVGHDQQDVWSPLGRHDAGRPKRLRLFGIEADLAAESRRRRRQVIAVNARGGVWRSRGACGSPRGVGRVRRGCHKRLLSSAGRKLLSPIAHESDEIDDQHMPDDPLGLSQNMRAYMGGTERAAHP